MPMVAYVVMYVHTQREAITDTCECVCMYLIVCVCVCVCVCMGVNGCVCVHAERTVDRTGENEVHANTPTF
jgi:hypothetical protein